MKTFLTPNDPKNRWVKSAQVGYRLAAASAFSLMSLTAAVGTAGLDAAQAATDTDFFGCVTGMTEVGISESDAISACSPTRYPSDLGVCVVDVAELTGLAAGDALQVCQRSRRPIEVANCAIDIHDSLLESPNAKVLENCGTSLMPERYGICVIDLVDAADVGVDDAMTQCLRAGFRPWRIQPRDLT